MLGRGLQSLIPPSDAAGEGNNPQEVNPGQTSLPHESGNSVPLENTPAIEEQIPPPPLPAVRRIVPPAEESVPQVVPVRKVHTEKQIEAVFHIELEKIEPNPDQPRRVFDEQALRELADSIREFGLLQPIVVSKIEREVPTGTEVTYQLIAGERRFLASKMLGLERIPAIIRNINLNRERLELAIIENIQRENLNPIESARAFARLQDEFRLTQREIATRLGKSRETIANTMRLLDLPSAMQEALQQGKISESHGRLLLSIAEPALQEKLFQDLLHNRMTTRELKLRVEQAKPKKAEERHEPASPELLALQEKLSADLGAPVKISGESPTSGGKITITFYSEEELQGIIEKLNQGKNI